MKHKRFLESLTIVIILLFVVNVATAQTPLGTSFTYQGVLKDCGTPAAGEYDFRFILYDDLDAGNQVGSTLFEENVVVSNGMFIVSLDFGSAAFDGEARYLDIGVRPGSSTGDYTALSPRQTLTPAPYATYSQSAGSLHGQPVTSTVPTTGQVLAWDGAAWGPADDADTHYTAGTGLSLVGGAFEIRTGYRLPQCTVTGQVPKWDQVSRVWVCGADIVGSGTAAWSLTGNSGTDPATNFVGTTDAVSLTLGVNGAPALRLEYTGGAPNVIGGDSNNSAGAGATGAVIGGGRLNTAGNPYASVGGGLHNTASNNYATVSGGGSNTASSYYATIGGGGSNAASGNEATVGGGGGNTASGFESTVGGGGGNTASGDNATVGGGWYNTASGNGGATIGGGYNNLASGHEATIGGGEENVASGDRAIIGGGYGNTAEGVGAFVGGGGYDGSTFGGNAALAPASTIGGGMGNVITASYATIGGGYGNTAEGVGAFVGGGGYDGSTFGGNAALAPASTIGGGMGNVITGTTGYATIGGGNGNTAWGYATTIGGGVNNVITTSYAAIGGGRNNVITGSIATIGGGNGNIASGIYATVGGGVGNTASGHAATVSGGQRNTASGGYAVVGGGTYNTASGHGAIVGGGVGNTASGNYATVAGGYDNTASGEGSFAAGIGAQAVHTGTFVWADYTPYPHEYFTSTADYQFLVRASGGVGIGTAAPQNQLHVQEEVNGAGTPGNHVVQIENTSTGVNPDVLALKVGYTGNPGDTINYLSFLKGDDSAVGAVEGNGSGGVTFKSGSGDYAEYMPRLDLQEVIVPGDVVGVFGGRVSRRTQGADAVLVASTRPIVLGNDPGEENAADYAKVAFVGQVEVQVYGPVAAGDFILPSGREDGTAIAVAPADLTSEQLAQVVGQAWSATEGPGLATVTVAVGLGQVAPGAAYVQNLAAENAALQVQVAGLEARLAALERQASGGAAAAFIQAGFLPGTGMALVGVLGLWLGRRKNR